MALVRHFASAAPLDVIPSLTLLRLPDCNAGMPAVPASSPSGRRALGGTRRFEPSTDPGGPIDPMGKLSNNDFLKRLERICTPRKPILMVRLWECRTNRESWTTDRRTAK